MKVSCPKSFEELAIKFLDQIFDNLVELNFDVKNWPIDHICYRVATDKDYLKGVEFLRQFSTQIAESPIAGRLISTFKLQQPIEYGQRLIDLIELPAPKKSKPFSEGFEHAEVITPWDLRTLPQKFRQFQWDNSSVNKPLNPEAKLKLDHNLQIKFHNQSLESIVNLENHKLIWKFLEDSQILTRLENYLPKIVGTYPLNIHGEDSDLDITLCGPLGDIQKTVRQYFSSTVGFSDHFGEDDSTPYYIAKFKFNRLPIEIYGQKQPHEFQRGYLHFLIEEQLLKVGGPQFREKVLSYRAKGLKTEPAFAKSLGIKGDPYLEFLRFQDISDFQARKIINQYL